MFGEFILELIFTAGSCLISFIAGVAYSEKHRTKGD